MFNVLLFFGCQVLTIVIVHLEEQLFEIRVIMFRVDNATDKGTETRIEHVIVFGDHWVRIVVGKIGMAVGDVGKDIRADVTVISAATLVSNEVDSFANFLASTKMVRTANAITRRAVTHHMALRFVEIMIKVMSRGRGSAFDGSHDLIDLVFVGHDVVVKMY